MDRIVGAVTYIGAEVLRPGVIDHRSAGRISQGDLSGFKKESAERIAGEFSEAGLDVKLSVDILREKWQKLVFNAAFNSVFTLTDSTFAEVAECEDSRDVAMSIVTEGIMIASREDVELPPDTSGSAFHLATALGNARSPMLSDRLAGRSMEVDALVSVTLRRGNQYGICTPATETVLGMLDHTNVETITRRDGIATDAFG